MIKSFKHKGLKRLFEKGASRGIRADHVAKVTMMLQVLDDAELIDELTSLWKCHELKGDRKGIWSFTISGNWRLTFEFIDGHAYILDYEDYH